MRSRLSRRTPRIERHPKPAPPTRTHGPLCLIGCFFLIGWVSSSLSCTAEDRELVHDPHFQNGFYLLEPKPGKRVVYGVLGGLDPAKPVWDLAQWSSIFPLQQGEHSSSPQTLVYSNKAKSVVVGTPGSAAADLSLAVNAEVEYPQARKSAKEPWVHLLVQQDFGNPPRLADISACNFHLEAQLKRSILVTSNDYSPSLHAAQYFVYLTVANRNPKAAGYGECFWFGIPIYDNRHRVVPAYEAQDFGETKLFIFTPASDIFAAKSTQDGDWVTFEEDLLPLIRQGLEHARDKGFMKGSQDLRRLLAAWDLHRLGGPRHV